MTTPLTVRMERIRTNKRALARAQHAPDVAIDSLRALAADQSALGNSAKAREYRRRADRLELRKLCCETSASSATGELDARLPPRGDDDGASGEAPPPADAVILYRLRERTHKSYVERRWPGRILRDEERRLEAEGKLYNPFDEGRFHNWAINLEWLEKTVAGPSVDDSGGGGGAPAFLLTAVPLSGANIYRTGARGIKFSAYAREIAYILLHGYAGGEQYRLEGQHVQCMRPVERKKMALNQFESDIAFAVLRNDRSIRKNLVLDLFCSRGIIVAS